MVEPEPVGMDEMVGEVVAESADDILVTTETQDSISSSFTSLEDNLSKNESVKEKKSGSGIFAGPRQEEDVFVKKKKKKKVFGISTRAGLPAESYEKTSAEQVLQLPDRSDRSEMSFLTTLAQFLFSFYLILYCFGSLLKWNVFLSLFLYSIPSSQ